MHTSIMESNTRQPRIQFICRAGVRIGLGHLMRTRTVAAETSPAADVEVVVIGDADIARAIVAGSVAWSAVDNDWHAFERVQSHRPDLVVFDLLEFDPRLLQYIVNQRRTATISPVFDGMGEMDAVFTRAALPPEVASQLEKPVVHAGPQFATIGPHCHPIHDLQFARNLEAEPLAVAVSMGGADAANHTLRILEAIREVDAPLLIWALLGEGYSHSYQALVDCVSRDMRHEIILAKTRDSMWRILSACSVAILAGGITTFEAAYAGIPAIVLLDRPHDRFLIEGLTGAGAAIEAGAPVDDASLNAVTRLIGELSADRERLANMHRAGRALLDGRGAKRIARRLRELCGVCVDERIAACG